MKVITLIQPWATLISLGEKKIETRSWKTKYCGELLIHAGKKVDKEICESEPYKSVLAKHGYDYNNLPTGVILAKCYLKECLLVVGKFKGYALMEDSTAVSSNEYEFGHFEIGRYGWILDNVELLNKPIMAKGQLNLWNFNMVKVGEESENNNNKVLL